MAGIDKQVLEAASRDFAEMWELAAPLLAKPHHVKFPATRMRPVVLIETVAFEDVLKEGTRWLQELRNAYKGRANQRQSARAWWEAQLATFPTLREAADAPSLLPEILELADAEWRRRLSHSVEQLVAALLGWDDARAVHLRRGDYMRLERADLRLTRCECGTDFFRRRSEPNAPNLCELCRERARVATYGAASFT
jgi:hypothetical protein